MALSVWIGIATVIFGLDAILKQAVEDTFRQGEERELAGGRIILRKVYNKGAMLNLLQDYPRIVAGISTVIGAAALLYDTVLLRRPRRFIRKLGMMLFTGGALSNIFDRLVRGKVIDYIGFRTRWRRLTSITYNIGDFAIFAGTFLALLSRGKRTP